MGRTPSSLALPPPPSAPGPLHPPPRRREPENRGEAEARTGGRAGEGTPRPAGPQSPPRAGRSRPEAPATRPGGQPAGSGWVGGQPLPRDAGPRGREAHTHALTRGEKAGLLPGDARPRGCLGGGRCQHPNGGAAAEAAD
ncbi:unnamed protein product [Rangifer tarandus platyrhynchus]|uniref:Uncharacterized protein n=1 Tax=Rangifer tarandus platyrhynchus TaxID=3082113 RepID=A0ABN9A5W3_RANTA|nr:unnamed protein product [Rangifer tarandus platyrhynchus]